MEENINAVVFQNLGLVKMMINNFKSNCEYQKEAAVDCEDLFQEGVIVLSKAVKLFDKDSGVSFSTYAYAAIKNAYCEIFESKKNIRSESLDDNKVISGMKAGRTGIDDFIIRESLISDLIELLPDKHKDSGRKLLERMYEGYTITDAAEVSGISKSVAYYMIKTMKSNKAQLPRELRCAS